MKQNLLNKFYLLLVLFCATLNVSAAPVEIQLYATDFTDWQAATAPTSVDFNTRFEGQKVTLSTTGSMVINPTATVSSRTGYIGLTGPNMSGTIETTAISNVTTVTYDVSIVRGSGLKFEVKGDGDADWVVLDETTPPVSTTKNITVNRNNVRMRWSNVNEKKAVYLSSVNIMGNVESSKVPSFSSFKINGKVYDATSMFSFQPDGTLKGALELSKGEQMVGSSNPMSDVIATSGTVSGVSYVGDAYKCTATINMTGSNGDATYVLDVTQYPDYTVTYVRKNNGETVTTQTIEKNSVIGTFPSEIVALPGNVLRGVYAQEIFKTSEGQPFDSYKKVSAAEYVVTGNVTLYVIDTPQETAESSRNEYLFNDHINGKLNPNFYMEDHEGIEVVSGAASFYNAQHGWKFAAGTQVDLLVSPKAQVALYLCSQNADENEISVGGTMVKAKQKENYTVSTVVSANAEGKVSLQFASDTYVHAIKVTNNIDDVVVENGEYLVVEANNADAFLAAVERANNTGNVKIYLPNGTYDMKETVLTAITADGISIIGESMDNTIIRNAPEGKKEGIGLTATILNWSTDLYMQDLTIENALDYYKVSTGRAVCLQDKGSNTICKNVKLLSHQDTYYSNAPSNFYWEDCEIHGTVDYICGDGNVVYNRTKLVNEVRSIAGTGETTIAAPNCTASTTARRNWGYVLLDCTIDVKGDKFNLGRAWGGESRLVYINTTILQPEILIKERFTTSGMNVAATGFYEYNSKDANGNVVTPASNVLKFVKGTDVKQYETVLTAAQAAEYTVANIYGAWAPDQIAAQVENVEDGTVFLANGEITSELPATGTVRVANARGGFGPEVSVTAIQNAPAVVGAKKAGQKVNALGQAVGANYRGIVIVNGDKVMQ